MSAWRRSLSIPGCCRTLIVPFSQENLSKCFIHWLCEDTVVSLNKIASGSPCLRKDKIMGVREKRLGKAKKLDTCTRTLRPFLLFGSKI